MGNTSSRVVTKNVYIQPTKEELQDAELSLLKAQVKNEVKATTLPSIDNATNRQVSFEDTFSITMNDNSGAVTETKNLIGTYFEALDPKIIEKFQNIFQACYDSRNLKTLDAVRIETMSYQTKAGNNAGMRMNYKIGVSKNKHWLKQNEFVMIIGMKFEVWALDTKVKLLTKAELYD